MLHTFTHTTYNLYNFLSMQFKDFVEIVTKIDEMKHCVLSVELK